MLNLEDMAVDTAPGGRNLGFSWILFEEQRHQNRGLEGNTNVASQVAGVVKDLPTNAGDTGSIPGPGRSPGEETPYSCLTNPMDREAWWATVLGSLIDMNEHTHIDTNTHIHTHNVAIKFP